MSRLQDAKLSATEQPCGANTHIQQTSGRKISGLLREEGSQLVEMALTIGILMTLLIGIFEISRALYSYNYVCDAAREATRWAIVRGSRCSGLTGCNADNSVIEAYVRGLGYPGIDSAQISTITNWYTPTWVTTGSTSTATFSTICTGTGCNDPGNQVQVQVTYHLPLHIPFIPARTLDMTSTSAMVIAQ